MARMGSRLVAPKELFSQTDNSVSSSLPRSNPALLTLPVCLHPAPSISMVGGAGERRYWLPLNWLSSPPEFWYPMFEQTSRKRNHKRDRRPNDSGAAHTGSEGSKNTKKGGSLAVAGGSLAALTGRTSTPSLQLGVYRPETTTPRVPRERPPTAPPAPPPPLPAGSACACAWEARGVLP